MRMHPVGDRITHINASFLIKCPMNAYFFFIYFIIIFFKKRKIYFTIAKRSRLSEAFTKITRGDKVALHVIPR